MSLNVQLKPINGKQLKSRFFNGLFIHDISKIPDGYRFFFQLVLKEVCEDDGILYVFVHPENEMDYKIHYSHDTQSLSKIKTPYQGYDMTFELTDDHFDGMKIWGYPVSLNVDFDTSERLLLQYDPYDIDDSPLFSHLDGYVYVMIHHDDLINKHYERAYLVCDRL